VVAEKVSAAFAIRESRIAPTLRRFGDQFLRCARIDVAVA
jgi:hypothetical protein